MKFLYEYRTRDNVKLKGEISAASREAAFASLRAQGIRPASFIEAPGFFNKVFGKGKRWLAIFFLSCLFLASLALLFSVKVKREHDVAFPYGATGDYARAIERRQIWGDEAVIEQAAKSYWRVVFSHEAERVLALFAQPGVTIDVFPQISESISQDFKVVLTNKLTISEADLDEYKQMKCIVEGMKAELRAYCDDGGTIDGYLKRLIARQREEVSFVEAMKEDLESRILNGEDPLISWQEVNFVLREQGLKTIPIPSM